MLALYLEKQKTHFILIAVYLIIALFLLLMVFNPVFFGKSDLSLNIKAILVVLALFDLWLYWSFSKLTIKITELDLEIGFGVFKKKFSFKQIKNCLLEEYQKSRYLGYGIRFGTDKSLGYVAKPGRGVRIKMLPKDYFFSTDQPEQVSLIINEKLAKQNYE